MIIYSVGCPLTQDLVEMAKAVAPDLHVRGDGVPVMGTWEDQFPVYDIVRMGPQVIAIFLMEEKVRHASR